MADFGLSRDIYTREYYASEDHSARLPVKWMALESLTKAHYSTRSDVVSIYLRIGYSLIGLYSGKTHPAPFLFTYLCIYLFLLS